MPEEVLYILAEMLAVAVFLFVLVVIFVVDNYYSRSGRVKSVRDTLVAAESKVTPT